MRFLFSTMRRIEFGEGAAGPNRNGDDGENPDFSRKAQIIADEIVPLATLRRREARGVELRMVSGHFQLDALAQLRETMARHPGNFRPSLRVVRPGETEALVELPQQLGIDPSDRFLHEVASIVGAGNVALR